MPTSFFSDQDHLDKEIEKLRKQLKVKVNRLFEAQGMGLEGTGSRAGRELSMSAWTLQSRGGRPSQVGGRGPRQHVSRTEAIGRPRDGMDKVYGVLFLSRVFFQP